MITYVLLTGCPPFQAKTLPELFAKIRNCSLKYMDADFADLSPESYKFVKSLLRVNPAERLTAEEALEHQWVVKTKGESTGLDDR